MILLYKVKGLWTSYASMPYHVPSDYNIDFQHMQAKITTQAIIDPISRPQAGEIIVQGPNNRPNPLFPEGLMKIDSVDILCFRPSAFGAMRKASSMTALGNQTQDPNNFEQEMPLSQKIESFLQNVQMQQTYLNERGEHFFVCS